MLDRLYVGFIIACVLVVFLGLKLMCDNWNSGQNQEETQTSREKRQAFILDNVVIKKACKKDHSRDFVLPHEIELSTRESEEQDRIDILQEEEEHTKDNILVESLREWRSMHHGIDDDGSTSSSLYSPKSCPICIEKYKDLDDICWSRNKKCYHAYHLNCMTQWLMKHDNCPMCRQKFL